MPDRPTYSDGVGAIVAAYGGDGDWEFESRFNDHAHGLSPQAWPAFWDVLEARVPAGSMSEVIAAWSKEELLPLWTEMVWAPMRTKDP